MSYALEHQRAELDRHRENSARLAQAFARFDHTGYGYVDYGERIDFGLTFVEQPYVATGASIDVDALRDELDLDDDDVCPLPIITGMVTRWDQDELDMYRGCWVAISIDFPAGIQVTNYGNVQTSVHFTFSAIAMKDVPTQLSS